jgi:hypothetical protein
MKLWHGLAVRHQKLSCHVCRMKLWHGLAVRPGTSSSVVMFVG